MFLSFPPPTKMFQFRGLAHLAMCQVFYLTGCPIQKSPDQILFANKSPELFAAYHVFLRLQEPRHSPYALIYFLTTSHAAYSRVKTLSHLLKYVNERRIFRSMSGG